MCSVPIVAVFYSSVALYFPGMLLGYFLNDFELVPFAPVFTGITLFLLLLLLLLLLLITQVDFMSHLAEQHPRTRERHHCLLCERSFPTAERYKMHLSGRTHRHLELTQRRTIHTLFSVFTGHNCPVLTPLSESELAGLKWFPVEPGTIHFYHQATPLQRAMQVIHFIICRGVKIYVFWNTVSFSVKYLPVSTAYTSQKS